MLHKAEFTFYPVTTAAEKATDTSEHMEQRDTDRKQIKSNATLYFLGNLCVNQQARTGPQKASVIHHSSETYS